MLKTHRFTGLFAFLITRAGVPDAIGHWLQEVLKSPAYFLLGVTGQVEIGLQPRRQPGAARPNADQGGVGCAAQQAAHALAQGGVERFGVEVEGRRRAHPACWLKYCSRIRAAEVASTSAAPTANAAVVV